MRTLPPRIRRLAMIVALAGATPTPALAGAYVNGGVGLHSGTGGQLVLPSGYGGVVVPLGGHSIQHSLMSSDMISDSSLISFIPSGSSLSGPLAPTIMSSSTLGTSLISPSLTDVDHVKYTLWASSSMIATGGGDGTNYQTGAGMGGGVTLIVTSAAPYRLTESFSWSSSWSTSILGAQTAGHISGDYVSQIYGFGNVSQTLQGSFSPDIGNQSSSFQLTMSGVIQPGIYFLQDEISVGVSAALPMTLMGEVSSTFDLVMGAEALVVPEPSSLFLSTIGLGLAAIRLARRSTRPTNT